MCCNSGGTQILDFDSTGTTDHAQADNLHLQHGAQVFVTVVAYNAAGLLTKLQANPVIIDKTPPVLCCLDVSQGDVHDVSYISSTNVVLYWQVTDAETGIKQCQYTLGRQFLLH